MDVTISQETYLRLPGLGDVKVLVKQLHAGTTVLSIQPISNLEISAKDIRSRFKDSGDDTSKNISAETKEENPASSPSVDLKTKHCSSDHPPTLFTIVVNMKEVDLALTDDVCTFVDIQELLRITLTNACVRLLPDLHSEHDSRQSTLEFSIEDLQCDNQLFQQGHFNFPVIFGRDLVSKETMVVVKVSLVNLFDISGVDVVFSPTVLYLEDTFLYMLKEYANLFQNIGSTEPNSSPRLLPHPVAVFVESSRNAMFFKAISIQEVCLKVNIYASLKLSIGLEDTVIRLGGFTRKNFLCSPYSLGHLISRHYLSGALFKAGWVVGGLDVIGNPAAFSRNVGEGLMDFITLPCEGLFNGPWGFIIGLTQGSSSLVKHVSAGTVTSITNFAKSVSRNLDKLTFDQEHLQRNEETRRLKPRGITDGFISGLSGVGLSMLGAIGGLAHHPLQAVLKDGASPLQLIGGVSKGLVGMVAKPLGGAAGLVASTGQGLLVTSGWSRERKAIKMAIPSLVMDLSSSSLKLKWKLCLDEPLLCCVDASLFKEDTCTSVTCVLTKDSLVIVNEDEDDIQIVYPVRDIRLKLSSEDPTLAALKILRPAPVPSEPQLHDRVARFVLESIQFAGKQTDVESYDEDMGLRIEDVEDECALYINPDLLIWFNQCLVSAQCNVVP